MKEYLIDSLRKNIVGQHGYPEQEGQRIEGIAGIRVKVPVGDTGATMEKSEMASYIAISVPANIAGKFDWHVESYKSIA